MAERALMGVAFCVALGLASAAPAQYVSSTHDLRTTPGSPLPEDLISGDASFRRMAACVVERQRTRVDYLLHAAPGSEAEVGMARSLQSRFDQCIPGYKSISFAWNVLRGGLAEAVYHLEFPNGLGTAKTPAAEALSAWTSPRSDEAGDQQLELLHSTARCMVAERPADVARFLATDPLSKAEGQVVGELRDLLGACLYQGITLTINRQSLRGLLAEAALEYGLAQRSGFAGVVMPAASHDASKAAE